MPNVGFEKVGIAPPGLNPASPGQGSVATVDGGSPGIARQTSSDRGNCDSRSQHNRAFFAPRRLLGYKRGGMKS